MKKINVLSSFLVVLMVLTMGCGQDKYDEFVDYNDQFVDITRTYIDSLDSAKNAAQVADAMNEYSEKFSKLIPKMQEISEKYPELLSDKDLPEKVVQSRAEATQIGMEFASSFMKTMKYITDPKVAQAQQEMGEMMKKLK